MLKIKRIVELELDELPDRIIVKYKGLDYLYYSSYQKLKQDTEEKGKTGWLGNWFGDLAWSSKNSCS